MADVALNTVVLPEADHVRPVVIRHERAFARGLVVAVLLSIPAWAAIAALVYLLV